MNNLIGALSAILIIAVLLFAEWIAAILIP
jgi:hypothetical protein